MTADACGTCRAPILWTRTAKNARPLPIDATLDADGTLSATEDPNGNLTPTGELDPEGWPIVRYITKADADGLFTPDHRWRPHFATCPDADLHRRR